MEFVIFSLQLIYVLQFLLQLMNGFISCVYFCHNRVHLFSKVILHFFDFLMKFLLNFYLMFGLDFFFFRKLFLLLFGFLEIILQLLIVDSESLQSISEHLIFVFEACVDLQKLRVFVCNFTVLIFAILTFDLDLSVNIDKLANLLQCLLIAVIVESLAFIGDAL